MKQFKIIIKDTIIAESEEQIMSGLRPAYDAMHKVGLRPRIEIKDTGRIIAPKKEHK